MTCHGSRERLLVQHVRIAVSLSSESKVVEEFGFIHVYPENVELECGER